MNYKEIINTIEKNGMKYELNFSKGNLMIGKSMIVENGIPKIPLEAVMDDDLDEIIQKMESLYDNYKNSVPTNLHKKAYFKALPEEELNHAVYLIGENRHIAQAKLEIYIFFLKLEHKLTDLFKGWFWRSPNDPDFVILKKWVC